jgi:hypothetical protein
VNGIVYAFSWYLDIVAEKWDALIADDYQAVFPLVFNRKYGIDYIYQPYFTQQLGLFSIGPISPDLVSKFLDAIPQNFRYISIQINTFTKVSYPSVKVVPRLTYHLDLIEPYPALSGRFSTNTKRNISKAVANSITIVKGLSAFQILELKRSSMVTPLKLKHFKILNRLITQSVGNGVGELYGAYTARNELCAGALFLKSNGKAIYLLASSTYEGREHRAMFALIDHYINQNSESHLILDFEGSNIESVAKFYAGFGAKPCEYSQITINRLPWFLKIFQ